MNIVLVCGFEGTRKVMISVITSFFFTQNVIQCKQLNLLIITKTDKCMEAIYGYKYIIGKRNE